MRKEIVALTIVKIIAICAIVPAVVSSSHQNGPQNEKEDYAMTSEDCTTCHSWDIYFESPHHNDLDKDCLDCHMDPPYFTVHRNCQSCHDVKREHHRLAHGPEDCATCHGTQS